MTQPRANEGLGPNDLRPFSGSAMSTVPPAESRWQTSETPCRSGLRYSRRCVQLRHPYSAATLWHDIHPPFWHDTPATILRGFGIMNGNRSLKMRLKPAMLEKPANRRIAASFAVRALNQRPSKP